LRRHGIRQDSAGRRHAQIVNRLGGRAAVGYSASWLWISAQMS
jgi:hypothetical protein